MLETSLVALMMMMMMMTMIITMMLTVMAKQGWAISIVCTIFFVLNNIVKNVDTDGFSKHCIVLHDVLGFRNCLKSFDKNLDIQAKM